MLSPYRLIAPRRLRSTLLLLAASLFAAGCGLSDYEKQMTGELERLEAFDKEAKFLNGPIVIPKVKKIVEDKTTLTREEVLVSGFEGVNLFLRVPVGFNTQADEKDGQGVPFTGTALTFRYSASKNNSNFREIRVAAAPADNKDFDKDLLQQGWNENFPSQLTPRKPYGREPLTFRTYEVPAADGATVYYNLYVPDAVRKKQGGDARLAIILVPKGKALATAKEQMEACLTGVGIGPEAKKLQEEYEFRRKHTPTPSAAPGTAKP